ncbi:MAG: GTPase Era [Alphaproteobacteria bacterium]|nr:GTPase Era [Alphaproteobacteria bacterium]
MNNGTRTEKRCGYVALVGAPNTGKSTLLNALVGSKVSIVSPKVQTTRSRVLGISIIEQSQVIFVDTPGIFEPRRRLDRAMVRAAWQSASGADLVALIIDANRRVDSDTQRIVEGLRENGRKSIAVLNKIDIVKRSSLLLLTERLNEQASYEEFFMISALTGDGVGDLSSYLARAVPPGPWLFPADQISDMPLRLLAAEITREKLYLQLHRELPYSAAVETESWQEFDDGSVRVGQIVYVQRPSQKAIVLGKGGQRVKAIGAAAREELMTILDRKVHLFLHVKTREKWIDDPERYRDLGLDFDA